MDGMDSKGTSPGVQVDRIDLIIQFCLAIASEGDPDERSLGPIHLIKYVYLADLFYAKEHQGTTFTGIPWQFYHYGPWSEQVWQRIEPAAYAINATSRTFHSTQYENDAIRYQADRDTPIEELESQLTFSVATQIRSALKKYRSYTAEMLQYVYTTKPMLNAAPGEKLDFSVVALEQTPQTLGVQNGLTKSQKKRVTEFQRILKERRTKPRSTLRSPPETPPKYDEDFYEIEELIMQQEGHIKPSHGVLTFSPEVWKSRARKGVESD
jgi:hypothetical protein